MTAPAPVVTATVSHRSLFMSARRGARAFLAVTPPARFTFDGQFARAMWLDWFLLPELLVDLRTRVLCGLLFPLKTGTVQGVIAWTRGLASPAIQVTAPPDVVPIDGDRSKWPSGAQVLQVEWCDLTEGACATQVASLLEASFIVRDAAEEPSLADILGLCVMDIDAILEEHGVRLPPTLA